MANLNFEIKGAESFLGLEKQLEKKVDETYTARYTDGNYYKLNFGGMRSANGILPYEKVADGTPINNPFYVAVANEPTQPKIKTAVETSEPTADAAAETVVATDTINYKAKCMELETELANCKAERDMFTTRDKENQEYIEKLLQHNADLQSGIIALQDKKITIAEIVDFVQCGKGLEFKVKSGE